MIVCSVSMAVMSSSSSVTSSPVVSSDLLLQQLQQTVDVGSLPLSSDASDRTEMKYVPNTVVDNCSLWQHGSMNGLPVSRHRHDSPDHSPRRLQRPDSSPYRVRTTDRSPLGQQTEARSIPVGGCSNSWQHYHSEQRNGLVSAADTEHMDTSDEMPLNLSLGVRSAERQSSIVDSRRRIYPAG